MSALYIAAASVAMAYIVTAYILMICMVMAYIVTAYIVMVCVVMTYIIMAYTAAASAEYADMPYTGMAHYVMLVILANTFVMTNYVR